MFLAISVYALAMTAANLSVAAFGPAISPLNAFLFIGLDLVLRDWLHVRLKLWQMGTLIASTGLLTYLLNPASGKIAIASAVAFTTAAIVDWAVFARLKGSWVKRANGSNVVGAAVDSIIFPTLAFGVLMPHIILFQFAAKVFGGFLWSLILKNNLGESNEQTRPA
ncbi:MAG: VUT family protein [Betaproteobacteria bacterium]|nr:VUT family protein [Betaproteobacteria bacterium]